ncbi:MAG: zinc-dependent peptidase [Phycisphaerales bacterium]|nr:zinc-dependent peptidase [Phycisphaerales bacterium]
MFRRLRERRRRRLRQTPLPPNWWAIIDRRVPMIREMGDDDRAELGGLVRVLLAEKRFEGVGGLEMTDEIRVTIAAQAAVLLLHRETRFYPTLRTILVYPAAYRATSTKANPDGTVTEGAQVRLGESWHRGAVVLSWSDVVRGAADDHDGHNVVLHEFAHQLDGENGQVNGAPALPSAARYRAWARVLGHEFEAMIESLHQGHRTLLDPYGAVSPPEFFAVATEHFFERPHAMRRHHPDLYEQLSLFYRQDPASRGPSPEQPDDRHEADESDHHPDD